MVVYSESESSLPRNGGKKQSPSKISAKYLLQACTLQEHGHRHLSYTAKDTSHVQSANSQDV